jgi:hypothetical protein
MTQAAQLMSFGQLVTANTVANSVTLSGNISGNNFSAIAMYAGTIGNTGAALSGATAALTGAVTGNTFAGIAVYAGTIGNTGAAHTGSTFTATGAVTGNTFAGIAVYANTIGNTGATLVGTIGTNAQPFITSLGTLSSLGVTGTSTLGAVTAATVSAGTIGNSGATINGTLGTAAQPSITSVGTLTSLISSGNITAQTANVYAGNVIANTAIYSANYYYSNGTAFSGGSNYGNTQVAAYLPTYAGNANVNNLTISGAISAANSYGTSGQALVSTGTGVQWGALSPGYNYSSQFNGSSQFLSIAANSAFNLGTNNFTMECWIYPTALPSNNSILIMMAQYDGALAATADAFIFALYNNAGTMQLLLQPVSGSTQSVISGTYAFSTNTWYHVAAVRNSNNVYLYVNGVQVGTTTAYSSSINTSSVVLSVGARVYSGAWQAGFSGFISNIRFVNGTAVYTSAFTPPTSSLSAITNTVLLTCNSITPTSDSSTYNWSITNNAAVTTTATQSPFTSTTVSIPTASLTAVRQQFTGDGSTTTFAVAGGYTPSAISIFLNGAMLRNGSDVTVTSGATVVFASAPPNTSVIDVIGTVPTTYSSITPVSYSTQFTAASTQYLSVPANAAFQMTGDFTIECWIYFTSFASSPVFFDQYVAGTTGAGNWQFSMTSGGILQLWYDGSSFVNSSTLSLNTWYHIAAVRIGTSIKIYINGVLATTQAFSGTLGRSDTTMWIGAQHASGPVDYTSAYISNVRFVKGLGVYTGNFTVPTSPLQATQLASGAYIQAISGTQTSLLTCNAPTIIDGSTNAFTITNNGSAPVSTSIVPTFTNVTINAPTLYYPANYLIVGGGGGGGNYGGGGGAGGMTTGTNIIIPGQIYSITIGAGGAGASSGSGSGTHGSTGTNSSFNYNVAFGGGGGGGNDPSTVAAHTGYNGGSGGGASYQNAVGVAGLGVPGQGFNGGTGTGSALTTVSGGGGGASAVGGTPNGGAGLSSSITGSAITYAGGGGAGGSLATGSTGGTGGGGNYGVAGTANLGGGGGGYNGSGAFAGGSGVVILSVPTANYTGTTTGSPTITTNGIYTVLKFTASGSYTA